MKSKNKKVISSHKSRTWKGIDGITSKIITKIIRNDKMEIIIPGVIAFLLHLNVLKGSFVYDDRMAIFGNYDVLGLRPWKDMLTRDFWGNSMSSDTSHKSYRPLTVLVFRLIHHIFGLEACSFHFCNLVLHALVCSCYAVLCRKIIVLSSSSSLLPINQKGQEEKYYYNLYHQKVQIWVASILFAVHPIHTEPVASIVGLSDIQCALFYVLGIIVLLHSVVIHEDRIGISKSQTCIPKSLIRTKFPTYFLAVFLAFCSSLSKEIGVMTFGIFLIYEIVLVMKLYHQVNSSQKSKTTLKRIMYNVYLKSPQNTIRIIFSFMCPVFITWGHLRLHGEKKIYSWTVLENHISLIECKLTRVLSYMNIHIIYLSKLIYPLRLSYDYGWQCFDPVESIADYKNLCTVLGYGFIIFISMRSLLQKDIILFFSICLLAIPFLPASNLFFPVGTVLAERLLYLPSMGYCLLASLVITKTLFATSKTKTNVKFKSKKRIPNQHKLLVSPFLYLFFVFLFILCLRTFTRCLEWNQEITLFQSAFEVCPSSLKVLNNLALVLLNTKDNSRAGELLDNALKIFPEFKSALCNRGLVYHFQNNHHKAISFFKKSLEYNPNDNKVIVYMSQSKLLLSIGQGANIIGNYTVEESNRLLLEESMRDVEKAIQSGTDLPVAYYIRCFIRNNLGIKKLNYGLDDCYFALDLNKWKKENHHREDLIDEEKAYNLIGTILGKLGRHDQAISIYREGLEKLRNNAKSTLSFELLVNLGNAYTTIKNYTDAMMNFEQALLITKNNSSPEVMTNIGWLLECQGKYKEAHDYYVKAANIMHPMVHPQLATNIRNIEAFMAQLNIE